jgi:hypothetical protein
MKEKCLQIWRAALGFLRTGKSVMEMRCEWCIPVRLLRYQSVPLKFAGMRSCTICDRCVGVHFPLPGELASSHELKAPILDGHRRGFRAIHRLGQANSKQAAGGHQK